MRIMQLIQSFRNRIASLFIDEAKPARPQPCRAPMMQGLEARTLFSAMAIGMNIERVADYGAAWTFTDAMKESRPWQMFDVNTATYQVTEDTTHPRILDAQGMPTRLDSFTNAQGQRINEVYNTYMFDGIDGHYPTGTYTAWWKGDATIRFTGDAVVTKTGLRPDGVTHFALLNVANPTRSGIMVQLTSINPANPIHDMHLWMPDYQGRSFVGQDWTPGAGFSPFHPLFLDRLSQFKTLRFMQDSAIVTSQVVHWSDRRAVNYETQMVALSRGVFQDGMAPEYEIELCNELNSDLWINIPHMADDDYARNLARLIKSQLKPNLKVYLEYSNEIWNGAPGFMAHDWVTRQIALPENAGVTFEQFVARQNRRFFADFAPAFSDQPGRLIRVVAGFEANPWYTNHVLMNMNGEFDAISIAAYFGPTPPQVNSYSASTTEQQIMSDTIATIPQNLSFITQHKQMVDQYSAQLGRRIQFVAYEGGASLIPNGRPWQTAMNAAASDPRMYDATAQWLTALNATGMDLMVNFEYTDRGGDTPQGVFGSLNYQDQPLSQAPKYRAALDAATGKLYPLSSLGTTGGNSGIGGGGSAGGTGAQGSGTGGAGASGSTTRAASLPVLMIVANRDFNYKEYADTRASLEAAGLQVAVGAGAKGPCAPHANSGQGSSTGVIIADLALADAKAGDYSAVIVVGGWGASEYQFAFPGAYTNAAYNGTAAIRGAFNNLICDFSRQGKFIAAICHGLTALAFARVDGKSPLSGKRVTSYEGVSPAFTYQGVSHPSDPDRSLVATSGATIAGPNSIGNPSTASDDVAIDGNLITAENWDSARLFGQTVANHVLGR